MRAARITAPETVEIATVPTPSPGCGEVLVELEGCGVCGSDIAVWRGTSRITYPCAAGEPGHEGWGVVAAVGSGVSGIAVGTRVAAISSRAHAEYDVVAANAVVPVPAFLSGSPFPGEALACAMNVARRCEFAPGQTVALVGVGFLGALLIQLAVQAGTHVIAISRRRYACEVAKRMGAHEVLPLSDDTVKAVADLTAGRMCERVLEVTGLQGPLDVAAKLASNRGRLIIAGFHQGASRTVDLEGWNWRGLDVINAHERSLSAYTDGVREAADAIARGVLDPSSLYTDAFPLERIADAFATAGIRPDGFLKAIVHP